MGITAITKDIAVEVQFRKKKNAVHQKKKVNNPLKTNTMHRKSRFIVGLAVAAITFCGFWFGMGSDHFNRGHRFCEREHGCMLEEHHRHCCEESKEIHADKVIIIKEVVKTDTIKK
jgi:hypothetical protein